MAKIIMIQGTMSNVGKSIITAGLCRVLKQDGYKVAPFKAQNMALNSYVTHDGFEMGRAQVVQAEACGIHPDVRMNPILLKPSGDGGSQVILNGEVMGYMDAVDYYRYKEKLRPHIQDAFDSLAKQYDVIVIEGAGSPAEINLKADDFVNMGMAKMANSPVILVGDIDRGGVFASIYGTIALLEDDEKDRIKGVIINKFRGDQNLLNPGLKMLEDLINKPVLGVIPMLSIDIDDEDSLSSKLNKKEAENAIDVAVIKLPMISNFTDFNSLERNSLVSVRYVEYEDELLTPDLIIIPGTKSTMADLEWLRSNGLENKIKRLVAANTPVIGICGGYQMLGMKLSDPYNIERGGEMMGMGLLDIETVFEQEKMRTLVDGTVQDVNGFFAKLSYSKFTGYEIHMGKTTVTGEVLSVLSTGEDDGSFNENILGTYVHGIFDDGNFYDKLIEIILEYKGYDAFEIDNIDYQIYKDKQYDLLAENLRENLDMNTIYKVLESGI